MSSMIPVASIEVPSGETAVLNCTSNDDDHIFKFWHLYPDYIIGPGYPYDKTKFKYEVLSGSLLIKNVSPEESGPYNCFSLNIEQRNRLKVGIVDLLVGGGANNDVVYDALKLIAIIISFIVLIGCGIIYAKLRHDWNRYDGRSLIPVDEEDDDDGEVVYNKTTRSINQPSPVPSRNASSDLLYGVDNQGLDTDFSSVFEHIQMKPDNSLI